MHSVGMLDKGMIHLRWDSMRFHATQNSMQFKTYELFISGLSHLKFLDCGWLRVTETRWGEDLLYCFPLLVLRHVIISSWYEFKYGNLNLVLP